MRTNMTLKPEVDQMLLNLLWKLCSDALLSTHENEYDLESERAPMLLHFLWNLFSDTLSSTHENKYDLDTGRGPDATQFPMEIVFRCTVIDAREITLITPIRPNTDCIQQRCTKDTSHASVL